MDANPIETPKTVGFTIRHPARVHLFKNSIFKLEEMGHDVHTYIVGSGIITELLDYYGIEYEQLASVHETLPELVAEQTKVEIRLLHRALKIKPDIMIDGIAGQHVSKVVGATSLSFMDTEHATLTKKITVPFADRIYTPDCYQQDFGEKQIRYPSYHELAYLHPNRFDPDPTVLDEVGLGVDNSFVILRLVGWNAVHDVGNSGFEDIEEVVTALEEMGVRVLITAEGMIPESVGHCQISVEPHRIHDLMYYADLFVGESGTMAIESAVLGTPAIIVSTLDAGVWNELDEKYGLLTRISEDRQEQQVVDRATKILKTDKEVWESKRETLLADKIDTTSFMLEQIRGVGKDV